MKELGALLRYGLYVPRLRLPRSVIAAAMGWASRPAGEQIRGARAICNWDEDALTLAIEAARSCLAADVDCPALEDLHSLIFGSTTLPFADRDNAVMLASALALPETVQSLNLSASLRVGTSGMINALRQGDDRISLLVAGDARLTRAGSPQELTYGDAAVAMLLGPDSPAALATVLAAASVGGDFVDHYRMSDAQFDYALEERWVRDEGLMKFIPSSVARLLSAAGMHGEQIRYLVVPTAAATATRLGRACGIDAARADDRVLRECGDAGAALPLLLLADALENARRGDFILVVGLGQGIDLLLLQVKNGIDDSQKKLGKALAAQHDEASYVRYLSHRGLLDVDFGMRAERDQRTAHTVAYRKRGALNAFIGGRCTQCHTVQFPPSRVCVNPECRATDTQTGYRLADSRGRVKSFTEDWQAYAARPPYVYGNVEFEEGGNLLMEFTDVEPGELKVNDPVRFVYRIKDEDRARGFRRYFWKATAVREQGVT